MQKKKLLPLSLMLLCGFCFSSGCSKTEETHVIATINGVSITTDNIYNTSLYSDTTAKYVYETLQKALIQSVILETDSMRTQAEREVENWDKDIRENATANGTNYQDDLRAALKELNVNSLKEYEDLKVYELQKQYAKERFLKAKNNEYKKAFIDANYVYQLADIVLNVSDSSKNAELYSTSIYSTDAKAIYDAITELVEGEKYYNVAQVYSKADSKDNGGEEGIVTLNDTDISNELRYALIGYSSLIENKYSEFNLPEYNTNSQDLYDLKTMYQEGIQAIPYSYIAGLNNTYSTSSNGTVTKNYETSQEFYYYSQSDSITTSRSYYRNIIFNNLLNTRVPRFITLTDEEVANYPKANVKKMSVLTPEVTKAGYSTTTSELNVLTNDAGNPYVVFKDSKGLHILNIIKTPFEENLDTYYSSKVDYTDDFLNYVEYGANQDERIEEIDALANRYITRDYGGNTANEDLSDYAMFEYYLSIAKSNGSFKIVDRNVSEMINRYITSNRNYVDTKIKANFEGYYENYSNLVWLRNQNFITKEIPLLSCLLKEDGNYGCTYKFGTGFINRYNPDND